MGSIGAMQSGSKDRYFQDHTTESKKLIPEGIEGRVPYKGTMKTILHQLMGGLELEYGLFGMQNISLMKSKTNFIKISSSSRVRAILMMLQLLKEPPNYQPR